MKRYLIIPASAAALFAAPAMAADLPTKAPIVAAPAVYSWTGFYVGGNVGANWQHASFSSTLIGCNIAGCASGLPHIGFDPAIAAAGTGSNTKAGFTGGGQIGYNLQSAAWVFGLEADWQWSALKDTHNHLGFVASGTSSNFAQVAAIDEQKLSSLGTARARLGWAGDCSLWYVTGGAAWSRVTEHYAFAATGAAPGGGVPRRGHPS